MNINNLNINNDDIMMNPKSFLKTDLNGKDMLILMKITDYCSRCDSNEDEGGQTTDDIVSFYILRDNQDFKKNTVEYSIKKLLKYDIIRHIPDKKLYQLSPKFVWLPTNPNNPTKSDYEALEDLKKRYL